MDLNEVMRRYSPSQREDIANAIQGALKHAERLEREGYWVNRPTPMTARAIDELVDELKAP